MSEPETQQTGSEQKASNQSRDFAEQAETSSPSLVVEFWAFVVHNKKWWIAPIIIVLLLVGLLIFLAGTPLGPMIYPGL